MIKKEDLEDIIENSEYLETLIENEGFEIAKSFEEINKKLDFIIKIILKEHDNKYCEHSGVKLDK